MNSHTINSILAGCNPLSRLVLTTSHDSNNVARLNLLSSSQQQQQQQQQHLQQQSHRSSSPLALLRALTSTASAPSSAVAASAALLAPSYAQLPSSKEVMLSAAVQQLERQSLELRIALLKANEEKRIMLNDRLASHLHIQQQLHANEIRNNNAKAHSMSHPPTTPQQSSNLASCRTSVHQAGVPLPLLGSLERVSVTSERSSLVLVKDCKTTEQVKQTLNILGTTLRSKADPYIDAAALPDPGAPHLPRGGVDELFPDKLYRMLREVEENGEDDVVSFLGHGRAFRVHDMDRFLKEIMPRYFCGQTKWGSFSRQLQLYGFMRVTSGRDAGCYYHELFLKGRPNLCNYMRRVGTPRGIDRRMFKYIEGEEPDFYALPSPTTSET